MDKQPDQPDKPSTAPDSADSTASDKPASDQPVMHASNVKDVIHEEATIQVIEERLDDEVHLSADEVAKKMFSSPRADSAPSGGKQFFDPTGGTAAAAKVAQEPIKRGIAFGFLSVLGVGFVIAAVTFVFWLIRPNFADTYELTTTATIRWHAFYNEWQKLGPDDFGGTIIANDPELITSVRESLNEYKRSLNAIANSSGLRSREVNDEYEKLRAVLLDGFERIDRSLDRIAIIQEAYARYRQLVDSQLYINVPEQMILLSYDPLINSSDQALADFYAEFFELVSEFPNNIPIDHNHPLRIPAVIQGPLDFPLADPDLVESLADAQRELFFTSVDAAKFTAALAAFDRVVFDHLPRDVAIQVRLAQWRDYDRIDDVHTFMSRIALFQRNSHNNRPPQYPDIDRYFSEYLNISRDNFRDPLTGEPYEFLNATEPGIGEIQHSGIGNICDGNRIVNNTDPLTINQSIAIRIRLERGENNFYCMDNQR